MHQNQDLARYGIEVHGIGNVAKTIGALDFYKEARLQNEGSEQAHMRK